jgi:hypothetical protein
MPCNCKCKHRQPQAGTETVRILRHLFSSSKKIFQLDHQDSLLYTVFFRTLHTLCHPLSIVRDPLINFLLKTHPPLLSPTMTSCSTAVRRTQPSSISSSRTRTVLYRAPATLALFPGQAPRLERSRTFLVTRCGRIVR